MFQGIFQKGVHFLENILNMSSNSKTKEPKNKFYHVIEFPRIHYASTHKQEALFLHEYCNLREKLCLDAEFYPTNPLLSVIPKMTIQQQKHKHTTPNPN